MTRDRTRYAACPARSSRRRPVGRGVVVGMLIADAALCPVGIHHFVGCFDRQRVEGIEPGNSPVDPVMPHRCHILRPVEAAECDRDRRAVVIAKGQRRAAFRAEIAVRERGTRKAGRRAASPGKPAALHRSPGGERATARLLSHAAMAEMDPLGRCGDRIAHGAALASAG